MKIIGITGKARSGKDTIARHLWTHHAYTRLAFADPLKRSVNESFGLTTEETHLDEMKEVTIPYWGLSPRQMLQQAGVMYRAQFGDDFWIKRWRMSFDMLKHTDDIVVPDVRFDNEAKVIRRLGGIIIEVQRGTGLVGSTGDHCSELGLSSLPDFVVDNKGTLPELYAQIDTIIEKWA